MGERPYEQKNYDFVVVGGGLSGLCCALAAARHGVKTALMQNRPVLGGNASSEVRMHICGADRHAERKNARETGIIEELLLKNRAVNPNHSFSTLDTVLWQEATLQQGLDLYLNTHVNSLEMRRSRIVAVLCDQMTSERRFRLSAPLFCDATGDASLAHWAGAETRVGREGAGEFGEHWAPPVADSHTMGSSLMFRAVRMNRPVPFIKPEWAYSFTEEDLKTRDHGIISAGYWWIELGGDALDTIGDAEQIRDELLKTVYGVWDHIKNGGDHGAQNYALEWVGHLPGKRESRRVVGDYLLCEEDLIKARVFEDAIAYGGWSMDCHAVGGIRAAEEPTQFLGDFDLYTIPYRCVYARDVDNLFIGGRAFSTTHMAFSSIRVMATCAVVGQAIGTAAAIAARESISPREVGGHMQELQQTLMLEDCYLPGYQNLHPMDIARQGRVACSSETPDGPARNITGGHMRDIHDARNAWISSPAEHTEWVRVSFGTPQRAEELLLRWDSDLSREIMITLNEEIQRSQREGPPRTLARNYVVELLLEGKVVHAEKVRDNVLRFRRHPLPGVSFDAARVTVQSTWGDPSARLFQMQIMRRRVRLMEHRGRQ